MTSPDDELVRRIRANQRSAYEQVVRDNYMGIYRQHRHLCGDSETASDLTQETFVQAWKSIGSFEGRSALSTWLYTIAMRVWRRSRATDLSQSWAEADEIVKLAHNDANPQDSLDWQIQQDDLHFALLRLPVLYRETVVLHYIQGLTYEETASALEIPVGTVKSRLHEALKRLQRMLSVLWEEGVTP